MKLRFWGVRGSVPVPGAHTLAVGGNTTCVSVESQEFVFVFDAGTGIRRLGEYLEAHDRSHWRGCIFISHFHWDHIQGLPFFIPAFRKENRFHLYGEAKQGMELHEILHDQMQAPYFPVSMDAQEGLVTFNPVTAGDRLDLTNDVCVRTLPLNHPNGAVGYRIESGSDSVCIITDHEHPRDHLDESVVEFARNASVLVHEAPYSPEEKRGPKEGWGHSSWEEAALVAKEASAGKLYLSHHEPTRSDPEVYEILSKARRVFPEAEVATEATVVDVSHVTQA